MAPREQSGKAGGGTSAKGGGPKTAKGTPASPSRTTGKKTAARRPSPKGGAKGGTKSGARSSKAAPKASTKASGKPASTPAAKSAAPAQAPLPLFARALIMVVAFAAMVGFAVVLSQLTLEPSAASKALTHNNLHPGDSIRNYLNQPAFRDTAKQLGGNIVLGMPFGLLLPVLAPRTRGLLRVILATAAVMLLVELVQGALIEGRSFDIDDVILNTGGAVAGYLLLGRRLGRAVHPPRRHWWQRWTKRTAAQ
jgi:hypothetical protein